MWPEVVEQFEFDEPFEDVDTMSTSISKAVPFDPTHRICACGCGDHFPINKYGRPRLYVNDIHKRRAQTERTKYRTAHMPREASPMLQEAMFSLTGEGENWPWYDALLTRAQVQVVEALASCPLGVTTFITALEELQSWKR
jgi:hypothetical protein